MKAMAFDRIPVLTDKGLPDGKSYIARGDLCEIAEKEKGLWPVTYPTRMGKKTRYVRSLEGFLCNQNDYGYITYPAPGYPSATIKSGGCGVCAACNLVGAMTGKLVPVRVMRDLAVQGQARVSGGTNMRQMAELMCREYGLRYRTSDSILELQRHLESGNAAICNTAGNGMFSTGGHYMAVLGKLGRQLCVSDSGLYTGKYRGRADRRWNVEVTGDLILTLPGTLDADCKGRHPRYYLFVKKVRRATVCRCLI